MSNALTLPKGVTKIIIVMDNGTAYDVPVESIHQVHLSVSTDEQGNPVANLSFDKIRGLRNVVFTEEEAKELPPETKELNP